MIWARLLLGAAYKCALIAAQLHPCIRSKTLGFHPLGATLNTTTLCCSKGSSVVPSSVAFRSELAGPAKRMFLDLRIAWHHPCSKPHFELCTTVTKRWDAYSQDLQNEGPPGLLKRLSVVALQGLPSYKVPGRLSATRPGFLARLLACLVS